jgi:hypothetical protein
VVGGVASVAVYQSLEEYRTLPSGSCLMEILVSGCLFPSGCLLRVDVVKGRTAEKIWAVVDDEIT